MIRTLQWRVAMGRVSSTRRPCKLRASAAAIPPRSRRLRRSVPAGPAAPASGPPGPESEPRPARGSGRRSPGALLRADLAGVGDFQDLEVPGAARRVHLDGVAGLAADQGLPERRADRQQPPLDLGLFRTDDLIDDLLFGLLVDQLHPGTELNRAATL